MEATIGNWVRQGRRRLDLTQTALASEVGCTESMLKKIEAGLRTPSPPLQARFELLLGGLEDRPSRPNISTELFTIIVADSASDHVVDDALHDLALGTFRGGLRPTSIVRLAPVDGHSVLAAENPSCGRVFVDALVTGGAIRVAMHCGVVSADVVVARALALFVEDPVGSSESAAVLAIAGPRTSGASTAPAEIHFANTGRLPRLPVNLVGRNDDLARLVPLLTDRSARLITLSGPGGVGKTALAVRAIEASRQVLPFHVVAVDLSAATDVSHAIDTLGAALEPLVLDEPGATWIERMSSWFGIVLIDSAEHVRGITDTLTRIAEETPATVVVTSRSRLGSPLETEFAVGPLSTTSWNGTRSDAAELFRQRAAYTGTSEAGQKAIEELCVRLDGLPLAIELAAARALQLPVSAMSENIAIRVADLSDSSPGLTPRHRTLRATLEWSLSLLDPVSISALRRLAVVEGSFDFDAVTRIGLRWPESRMSPDALLDELVTNSLAIRSTPRPTDAGAGVEQPTQWSIYGTLREVLRSSGGGADEQRTKDDHAAWIFDVAERLAPELYGPNQERSFERLIHALPDLRQAIGRVIDLGDGDRVAPVVSALHRFWSRAGMFAEARSWSARILLCELGPARRARLLNTAGALAFMAGDAAAAVGPFTSSQILFAEVGDANGEADALANLGVYFGELGRHEEGVSCTERSLELRRRIGDRRGVGISLGNLGQFASLRGDLAAGRQFLSESVIVHREIDDGYLLVEALLDLARIEAADDRLDRAGTNLIEALGIAERLRAGATIASVLQTLVNVCAPGYLRAERCRLGAQLIGAAQAARRRAHVRAAEADSPAVVHIAGSLGPRAWETNLAEGAVLSPGDLAAVAERFAHRPRQSRDLATRSELSLSARELRVLRLLGDGATNKDIARELTIRPSTVASHVRTLFAKLGVTSRAAAVAAAADLGLR